MITDKKISKLNLALACGLSMGLITGILQTINMSISLYFPQFPNTLLSILKLIISIVFFYFLINKLRLIKNNNTFSDFFKFAMLITLSSALVSTLLFAIDITYIHHNAIEQALQAIKKAILSTELDNRSKEVMNSLYNNIESMLSISYMLYCIIFGTVFSAILSSIAASKTNKENQDANELQ